MERLKAITLGAFVFLFSGVLWGGGDDQIKVLIITGQSDLPYHVWQETTASMRSILERSGRFSTRVTEEPRGLNRLALQGYQALVLNYNGPRLPRDAESAVEEFVRSGGGLVAVHQASYGAFHGQVFENGRWQSGERGTGWEAFPEIIGATWAPEDIGHARRTVFQVDWVVRDHPVSKGLPAAFVANDELYHKIKLSPQVRVLADALSPSDLGGTGRREPLVWTNRFGEGRIFFTPLGHDTSAWFEPGMANLFSRGVEWAAIGHVTIPPVGRGHSQERQERDTVRVLVVTGGHGYPVEFYNMLNSLPQVRWTHATSQAEAFSNPVIGRFDAILLHDMHETTTIETRTRLQEFVEGGGGVVAVHHAIVDYSDWPWWYREVIGGKYFVQPDQGHPASSFREGVQFLVTPVRGQHDHPVLDGIAPLWVDDELYKGMYHSPEIEVLMETAHPDNDPPVVYVGPYSKARILYIQLGHSVSTMENPGFRRLVSNSLRWVSKKEAKP